MLASVVVFKQADDLKNPASPRKPHRLLEAIDVTHLDSVRDGRFLLPIQKSLSRGEPFDGCPSRRVFAPCEDSFPERVPAFFRNLNHHSLAKFAGSNHVP